MDTPKEDNVVEMPVPAEPKKEGILPEARVKQIRRKYAKREKKRNPKGKLPPALVAHQFKKGVSQLLLKKGVKKATEEFLKLSLDYTVPDEWLVNGLELLRGRRMTFGQVITFRMLHSATTGVRNPGLKDIQVIFERVLGRMPTTIKYGEADPEDDFESMTGEELIQLGLKLADSIQAKRLPAPAPPEDVKVADESTTESTQSDAPQGS
jgi:hypothetical protein